MLQALQPVRPSSVHSFPRTGVSGHAIAGSLSPHPAPAGFLRGSRPGQPGPAVLREHLAAAAAARGQA